MSNPHRGQPIARRGKPLQESRAVMVMMHGRGRDTDDILAVAERIGDPHVAYLAPAASDHTWYPYPFLEPIEKNEPYLSYALEVYDELIAGLVAEGIDRRRIVLAGFSQGACLTAEYTIRHAARYGGIVLFTGGLIGPPGMRWPYGGSFDGTPILLSGSDADSWVPVWRVRESAAAFRALGAHVTEQFYPGDSHEVTDAEVAAARVILAVAAGTVPE